MSSFRKLAQTIWPCQYLMVRVPRYRHRVLDGQIAIEVETCIKGFSEQKESEIVELRETARTKRAVRQLNPWDNSLCPFTGLGRLPPFQG